MPDARPAGVMTPQGPRGALCPWKRMRCARGRKDREGTDSGLPGVRSLVPDQRGRLTPRATLSYRAERIRPQRRATVVRRDHLSSAWLALKAFAPRPRATEPGRARPVWQARLCVAQASAL